MLIAKTQPLVNIEDCQFPIIRLTKGFSTIVDLADLPWIQMYRWIALKSAGKWYAARRVIHSGKSHYIRLHREIMNCPEDLEVHHLNGNGLDNRRCNLVCVSREENHRLENS